MSIYFIFGNIIDTMDFENKCACAKAHMFNSILYTSNESRPEIDCIN